ncbi:hypothetical protein L207DRAFT_505493 [Hyaloscypha variabilis F]|uniref:Uncharacterized protein n=1 Tax=Hyaloscypha variabilis (strain UAMH 11265 / GT02V1 / F) TaxID=1149755 RepID=A0A2J6SCG8_HYAVF|nr:hypothetical protein L207DRAFT_505493 [Hyaloscypha variabilis F]
MDGSGFSLIVMATSGLCPIESVCGSPVTSRKFTSIDLGAMTDQFLRIHNIKPSCRPYPAHFPEPPSPPPSQPPLPSMAPPHCLTSQPTTNPAANSPTSTSSDPTSQPSNRTPGASTTPATTSRGSSSISPAP